MNSSKFRGSTVALVTPFDSSGNVNEIQLGNLIDRQIEQGTDVILICGTTGESATMSHEEQQYVLELAIKQINRRVPVLCGTGCNDTRETIRLSQQAEKIGGDAVLLVGPYYNKPTQEGFFQHFKKVAESVSIPVILYNVPGRTGSNIAAETTLRLAAVDNIIGIKEASGNMSQIMNILRNRPPGFLVLSGDDLISLPLIALGGDGTISVVANEVPALFSQMIHNALDDNWSRALELHNKLLPLMEINFIESSPIPVKTALAMMKLIDENFRLPLVPLSSKNRPLLQKVLVELGLV
jgi:4-hydroxy-tetrahydrodipicolinate synthase